MARAPKKTSRPKYDADNNPAKYGVVAARQQRALRLVRDVYGGTFAMQDNASDYLPQWPKEEPEDYTRRVKAAVLFNGFKRSVKGLTGMVYRKDPVVSDQLPKQVADDLKDVDMQGRDLSTFCRENFQEGMIDGHAAIFVDQPPIPAETPPSSLADERRLGLRPYWVAIKKADILRFKTIRIGSRNLLAEIAWLERTIERVGDFKESQVTRVRELRLAMQPDASGRPQLVVAWTLYEQAKPSDDTSWFAKDSGTLGKMTEIPVATTYTDYVDTLESEPPLLDLAFEALAHLRKRSDCDNLEHVTCVPILSLSGVTDDIDSIAVGAAIGLKFSDPQAGAKWAEITGAGIEKVQNSIQMIEQRMAILGLSMLQSETRAAETATSKEINKSETDSQLSAAARSNQQAICQAVRFHAMWKGIDITAVETPVTINQDFKNLALDAQMIAVLQALVEAQLLSVETLWAILTEGEILPDSFDPKVERNNIMNGDLSQLATIAENLRMAAAKAPNDPSKRGATITMDNGRSARVTPDTQE